MQASSLGDPALLRLLACYEAPSTVKEAEARLAALAAEAPRLDALARDADRRRPRLEGGEVRYDASYLQLRAAARRHRVITCAWEPLGELARAPRTVHFALGYVYAQEESGYYCPACMTDGAAWVLARHAPEELRDTYLPGLLAAEAEGSLEGAMLLTEKGGGSDVGGATQTRAEPDGARWRLHGAKWFASNASAEVILTLARMPGGAPGTRGLGLFLVPRVLPGGERNEGIVLAKLKDKLGTGSMATAELEFHGAQAFLLKGPGEGFKAMAEMVNLSRLYNSVASVAVARRALREALRWGAEREAFGARLNDLPLYRRSLVLMALEVEGGLAVALETAHAMDRAALDPRGAALLRALTPLAKACTARMAVKASSEACEMLGGNGYVEDQVTPRLLRDAQVLPIWEGTTNIQALDLLRAAREGALDALEGRAARLLEEAERAGSQRDTLRALEGAWARLAAEAREAQGWEAQRREAAAWRWTQERYRALAATLLAWSATKATGEEAARAALVAEGYAQLWVAPGGAAGQRWLEALPAPDALRIAGARPEGADRTPQANL